MIKKEFSLINWIEFKCLTFCNSELLCFCCPNRQWILPTARAIYPPPTTDSPIRSKNTKWLMEEIYQRQKLQKPHNIRVLHKYGSNIHQNTQYTWGFNIIFRGNSVKIHVCIYKMWKLWIQIRFRPKNGFKDT